MIGINKQKDKGRLEQDDLDVAARYRLNDIFCTSWMSRAISALVKQGVADALQDEPLRAEEIALARNLHPPTVFRVLRGLAANGIFEQTSEGKFRHNHVSRLLRSDHPYSWAGMARMWGHEACSRAWDKYGDSLSNGDSGIKNASGKTLYQYLHEDHDAAEAFAGAMISNSSHASRGIARAFPFEKYESVADLGGGVGTLLSILLKTHLKLSGYLLEIADLEKDALACIKQDGLEDRCKFVRGNFLESIDCEADLYLIKNSLWNWKDDDCARILSNVRKAMGTRKQTRFLLIEYIINEENAEWTTLFDLQILNLPGGRARTEAEYLHLLREAGLDIEEKIDVEDQTVLVAKPV